MNKKIKIGIIGLTIVVLVAFYFLAQRISPEDLKNAGPSLPLPLLTFLIAIIDGFNPCNLFVLTLLISLMLTESHQRKRIYAVGYTFIIVILLFYFLFMAAWLNIFKYIGFIDPLRIGIAVIALVAGFINAKEFFFYRKGITLMVQDRHVGPLKKRIANLSKLIKRGSIPTLIGASAVLAIFASLVELPCTAGFPIIYTGILSGMGLSSGFGHYLYLLLYSFIYVLPLFVIMTILGYTFNGKTIEKKTMGLIKFIGGVIMIILGIILLVNPGLIGMG